MYDGRDKHDNAEVPNLGVSKKTIVFEASSALHAFLHNMNISGISHLAYSLSTGDNVSFEVEHNRRSWHRKPKTIQLRSPVVDTLLLDRTHLRKPPRSRGSRPACIKLPTTKTDLRRLSVIRGNWNMWKRGFC